MKNPKAKVLIVDDEQDILDFLEYNLKKEDIQVVTALDGKEGLRLAGMELPDVIVLDVMMPEMDGIEVCKILRQDDRFDDTIITFLTARNEDYLHTSGLNLGADDFITKPIKPALFMSRLKALIRRSPRYKELLREPKVIEVGDIRLDEGTYTVQGPDVSFELPRKEFKLLALLMSKPGKVFQRDQIFREVWGNEVIVGNRTIDVHVRKLREKLGDNFIKTVKGVGYKFDA